MNEKKFIQYANEAMAQLVQDTLRNMYENPKMWAAVDHDKVLAILGYKAHKCECGAEAVNCASHSAWCPKHKEEK